MKWLKRIGLVVGALLLALAVVPFFISLDDSIPTIEREVSARLKEPVTIGSLRVAGLPLPHLTISGITVGRAQDIKVGKVTVTPDLWTLLDDTKVIKSIEIDGLVLTQKAIEKIPAWIPADAKAGQPSRPPAVRLEAIKLDDAVIKLEKTTFGPFDARLSLSHDGNLESISVTSRDGALKASVKPQQSSYLIDASARAWRPPLGPAIHFDELVVKGMATPRGASFSDLRAKLYGGTVTGRLVVGWEKGVQLKGSAYVDKVEINPLLKALGKPQNMSGRLSARPVFSANAAEAEQILDALRLDTPFEVQGGVLHGVDIRKAATSLINKDGGKGGETRFDKLAGQLNINRGTRRLTRLDIASGSLSADGNVTISPRDELSGRINTRVKATSVAAVAVPLNVSGTLDSPLLYPTGGTVAGAAAGTAVLGPGVGTAIGARAGQWFENLFGKKEEKK
ncbi:MAG: AsmA-like C-terminal region-containing protein [Burkholderiales bacterium]